MTGYIIKNLLLAILLITPLSCGQDTPLAEYEPKSPRETALKNVLLNFQAAVNAREHRKIADLIHADAAIMTGRDRKIISRAEYVSILPQRLAENPPVYLGKPKIKVDDNNAVVKVYMSRGKAKVLVVFHMQFDNNKWFIKGWEY